MSRCRCCDQVLSQTELLGSSPDGSPETMCYRCITRVVIADPSAPYLQSEDFCFEGLEEGLQPKHPNSL